MNLVGVDAGNGGSSRARTRPSGIQALSRRCSWNPRQGAQAAEARPSEFVVETSGARGRAAQIVPMNQSRATRPRGAREIDGALTTATRAARRQQASRGSAPWGVGTPPTPPTPIHKIKGMLIMAALRSIFHQRHLLSLVGGTTPFGEVGPGDYFIGNEWTPRFSGAPSACSRWSRNDADQRVARWWSCPRLAAAIIERVRHPRVRKIIKPIRELMAASPIVSASLPLPIQRASCARVGSGGPFERPVRRSIIGS